MRREAKPSLFKSNQQAPITGLLSVVTQDTNTNASTKRAHARYNVEGIAEGEREKDDALSVSRVPEGTQSARVCVHTEGKPSRIVRCVKDTA